ncbi:DUF2333 family protein [Mesorhizobium sp. CAU 1732]|uniref:DUF2333 family protein n=1 Tax=Mesorhizobium sp. CAU 1732 TaxID=3140358 RepID=UPI0032606034
MFDPIVSFFTRVFQAIGRGIGMLVAWIVWPFVAASQWYARRGWIIKGPIGIGLILLIALYGYFIWNTQRWTNFDTAYAEKYDFTAAPAGGANPQTETTDPVEGEVKTCTRSAIVDVTADLIDFNVNQNGWISSMILYKLGLFGMDWDHTPWLDNKASFQRGINQAIRRTSIELVDTLGRVRGTSQIDQNLQDARGSIAFDEETWYFGLNPFGPKTPTPSFYRSAERSLRAFNDRMQNCQVVFNARADNLMQFVDRIAGDIGSTSDLIQERSQNHNGGWFDTRADDRFWFAYGQLYGYYGILTAARHDFQQVITSRELGPLWQAVEEQMRAALNIQPFIISNGREDGWIMPTHLTTMGFYVLRVRSNLVELRQVLDR